MEDSYNLQTQKHLGTPKQQLPPQKQLRTAKQLLTQKQLGTRKQTLRSGHLKIRNCQLKQMLKNGMRNQQPNQE